jgi:tRNA 2-selenouridine synthase
MPKRFLAEQISEIIASRVLLDVRTPSEFAQGHIPGALNLPLFSDAERAEVGTLYKQVSPEQAFLKGLEFAGARMRQYVEQAMELAPERRIAVHCWRGGQRSGSMAWLLETAGFDVVTLQGGYKAWRGYVLEQLASRPMRIIVLGGKTGSGKTRILHALRQAGQQILDLEALAHHKGSAFGAIGELPQPSFEQFSNNLYEAVAQLDTSSPVWVESESKAIGKVQIPEEWWHRICAAPMIEAEIPFEERIRHLIEVYADFPQEQLADSFQRIAKRIGGLNVKLALEALADNRYDIAAAIALAYYDKTYRHSLDAMNKGRHFQISPPELNPTAIAAQLIEFIQQQDIWK